MYDNTYELSYYDQGCFSWTKKCFTFNELILDNKGTLLCKILLESSLSNNESIFFFNIYQFCFKKSIHYDEYSKFQYWCYVKPLDFMICQHDIRNLSKNFKIFRVWYLNILYKTKTLELMNMLFWAFDSRIFIQIMKLSN